MNGLILKAFYVFASAAGVFTGVVLVYGWVQELHANPMNAWGAVFNAGVIAGGVVWSYRKYGKDIKELFHQTKLNHLHCQRIERKADLALTTLLMRESDTKGSLAAAIRMIDHQ